MTPIESGLQALEGRHPEWKPWLAVVRGVLAETANPTWDAVVPGRSERQRSKIPLLADAIVRLDESVVGRLLDQLLRIASRSGSPKLATLEPARRAGFDPLTLVEDSLCHDSDRLGQARALVYAVPEALHAIAALVSGPFLHS